MLERSISSAFPTKGITITFSRSGRPVSKIKLDFIYVSFLFFKGAGGGGEVKCSPIIGAKFLTYQVKPVVNQKSMELKWFGFPVQSKIGPLQLAIHVALGQDKQKAHIILNGNFLCLSSPSATFALQHGGYVPREWLTAKGLLVAYTTCHPTQQTLHASLHTYFVQLELVSPNGCVSSCYIWQHLLKK